MFWRNVATGGQTGPGGPSPPPPPHPKLSLADAWSIPGSWPGRPGVPSQISHLAHQDGFTLSYGGFFIATWQAIRWW